VPGTRVDRLKNLFERRVAYSVAMATRIALVALACVLGAAACNAGAETVLAPRTYEGDFDTCELDQWGDVSAVLADGVTITRSPVAEGDCAARFHVASGGDYAWLVNRADSVAGVEGDERWYHWKTYFPADFMPSQGEWNWLMLLNDLLDSSCPPTCGNVSFSIRNWPPAEPEMLALRIQGGDPFAPDQTWFTAGSLVREHWHDNLAHLVLSADPARGFVEWWLDGTLVVQAHLATLFRAPEGGTVPIIEELGYYRVASSFDAVLYHDGFRRGPSRASVEF